MEVDMKKIYPLVVLIIISSFVFCFAAPARAMTGGTWQSGIKLQNLSNSEAANIQIELYTPAGALNSTIDKTSGGQPLSAPISGSVEVYLPNYGTIGSGQYSAIVSSNKPLGVVVTTTDYDYGIADSYNSMEPSNLVYIPNVYHNHNSWSTEIFVQNTTGNTITGNAYLEEPAGGVSSSDGLGDQTVPLSIPAHATVSIDTSQAQFANMGWFIGAGRLVMDGPVSVVANQTRLVGTGDTMGNVLIQTPGVTANDSGSKVVLPSLYNNFSGVSGTWKSGIKLQNITASDVNATVTFKSDPDSASFTGVKTVSVPADGSTELYLPGLPLDVGTMPDMFKGSAVINVTTPGGQLTATVQHTNYAAAGGYGVALGYIGFASGLDEVSLPSLYRWPSGAGIWISGIKIQNIGANQVTVGVSFSTDPDVSTWTGSRTGLVLNAGESTELYLGNPILDGGGSVPQPWKGSALVTATGTGEKKIVATVLHTNYGRKVANMYTGIPLSATP
jgi:hypothetical protein